MTSKALSYAEVELGVHKVYEEAVAAAGLLPAVHTRMTYKKTERREIKEQIAQREVEVYVEEGGKHPTMSLTGLKDHVKVTRQMDPVLTELRARADEVEADIENLEFEVREHELTIKIREARMTELGGYLNYLAIVKSMSQQTETKD